MLFSNLEHSPKSCLHILFFSVMSGITPRTVEIQAGISYSFYLISHIPTPFSGCTSVSVLSLSLSIVLSVSSSALSNTTARLNTRDFTVNEIHYLMPHSVFS